MTLNDYSKNIGGLGQSPPSKPPRPMKPKNYGSLDTTTYTTPPPPPPPSSSAAAAAAKTSSLNSHSSVVPSIVHIQPNGDLNGPTNDIKDNMNSKSKNHHENSRSSIAMDMDDDLENDSNNDQFSHYHPNTTHSPAFYSFIRTVAIFVGVFLIVGSWKQLDPLAHDLYDDDEADTENNRYNKRNDVYVATSHSLRREGEILGSPNSDNWNLNARININYKSDFYTNLTKFYNAYPRRPFITHNHQNITLPVIGFPSVSLARLTSPSTDQPIANEAVRHAVEDLSIQYFDVAPEYGDGVAQERLGPALKPYRSKVFLAAKTMYRTAHESEIDLHNTLKALQTDHLNLYQFHSISTQSDVDTILGNGGAMETFQKAKRDGIIKAIGFSAHNEEMAIQMIQTGLVDTMMFPINFAAYHYGGVGQKVLDMAMQYDVGVIALKSGARGRLTNSTGNPITVPKQGELKHIPEWKRQEMIHYPVMTSKTHPTCWYEPEDNEYYLHKLVVWSLNQRGVTAVLPPGDLGLLEGIAEMLLHAGGKVPELEEGDVEDMLERYKDVKPIFHGWDESGTKVST